MRINRLVFTLLLLLCAASARAQVPVTVVDPVTHLPATLIGDPISATATSANECPIVSAASTNSTSCVAAPANLYGFELYNTTTTIYYLRLYNLAAGPTCSSATGFVRSIPISPAPAAGQLGGVIRVALVPKNYSTGIAYCITAGSSSTDNTNAAVGIFGVLVTK